MRNKTKAETRREFLKTAAKGVAATAFTAALTPAIVPARSAHAGVETINFAYILSDHHAPLMVMAKHWELFQEKFNMYIKPLTEGRFYDFYHDGNKVALFAVPTKKGPDVEKLVAQGSVDIAISGTQAVLMSLDKGIETQLISPLQTAGNVFVLKKELPVNTWAEFISDVKGKRRIEVRPEVGESICPVRIRLPLLFSDQPWITKASPILKMLATKTPTFYSSI